MAKNPQKLTRSKALQELLDEYCPKKTSPRRTGELREAIAPFEHRISFRLVPHIAA